MFTFEESTPPYWGVITGKDDDGYNFDIDFKSGETVEFESDNITISFQTDGVFISMAWVDDCGYKGYMDIPEDNDGAFSESYSGYRLSDITFRNVIIEGGSTQIEGTFNNVYSINKDILGELMNDKIIVSSDGSTKYLDKTEFIINVLELPFKLDLDIISDEEYNIKLGDYISKVKAPILNLDRLIIDLGTINTPTKFNNAYDYINTDINIHLPFVGTVKLLPEYVIGFDISVNYVLDVYTGDTTINIITSNGDIVIESFSSDLGRDIPITMINKTIGHMVKSGGLMNYIETPFIEIIRNRVSNLNLFNNLILKQSELSYVYGYIQVTNILLDSKATLSETDDIIRLLQGGVYINEN